jgi:hypothetical protein
MASGMFLALARIAVSSAYSAWVKLWLTGDGKSEVKMLNRVGAMIDPCGTPARMSRTSEH